MQLINIINDLDGQGDFFIFLLNQTLPHFGLFHLADLQDETRHVRLFESKFVQCDLQVRFGMHHRND
jgi:hypothetical protein